MPLHLILRRKNSQAASTSQADFSKGIVASSADSLALWKRLGCSLLLLGLFAEWLHPLAQLKGYTDLQQLSPLFLTILGGFLIGVWVQSTLWSRSLKLLLILMMTAWAFGRVIVGWPEELGVVSFTQASASMLIIGFEKLLLAIKHDFLGLLAGLTSGEWILASGEVRTLLLLAVIMVLVSLVQSLMLVNYSVLLFCGATGLYLFFLQIALGFDTSMGLIRTLAWSAALVAWVRMLEASERDQQLAAQAWPTRWWLLTVGTSVAIMLLFAGWNQLNRWEAPQAWPEVHGWIEEQLTGKPAARSSLSAAEQLLATEKQGLQWKPSTMIATTGYGEDDERLGAPLQDDHRMLFTAISPEPTYWKLEIKRDYTGKGWTSPDMPMEWIDASGSLQGYYEAESGNEPMKGWSAPFTQSIAIPHYQGQFPLAFGGRPEQLLTWGANDNEALPDALKLKYEPAYERYRANRDNSAEAGSFTYSYQTRTWSGQHVLSAVDDSSLADQETAIPAAILQSYTALPDSLPERIRTLTAQITAGEKTRLAKAAAVQSFLLNNYAYTKAETQVPREEADFVDAFLFEQKQGYCVHFSTAMAVMLRTQGIPTRWVKGFAPGESSSPGQYIIRASDAHAWVEIYEPGLGWIPFEATPASGVGSTSTALLESESALPQADSSEKVDERSQLLAGSDVIQPPLVEGRAPSVEVKTLEEREVHPLSMNGGVMALITEWSQSALEKLQQWSASVSEYSASMLQQWHTEREQLASFSWWQQLFEVVGAGDSSPYRSPLELYPMHMSLLAVPCVLLLLFAIFHAKRWIYWRMPLWRMKRLIHAQQQHFHEERVQQMGELAWRLIERKYGARPRYMTLEEYSRQLSDVGLPAEQSQLLIQFAADCQTLLFARHQGDRTARKRFIDGCLSVLKGVSSKDRKLAQ